MKALTIGGAMIDTIAIVNDDLIERISLSNAGKTFLLLEQGSKTEAEDISTHCGGGAINAAVALARLGFDVSVVAKLGEDARANLVRAALEREGISSTFLRTTPALPTGASAIIAAHDRNAGVFTFRGANTALTAEDIDAKAFAVDLVYISTLSGDSAAMLPALVETARKCARFVAVNPGIRQITTRFGLLRSILGSIDLVALNRSEAEAFMRQSVAELSGSENTHLRQIAAASLHRAQDTDAPSRSAQARALIEGFMTLGAHRILLTDGRRGAYFGANGKVHFCPSLDVPVASTAGAGDAYLSTFSALHVQGLSIADTMKGASANAAAVVMRADTQSGLMHRSELMSRLIKSDASLVPQEWPL